MDNQEKKLPTSDKPQCVSQPSVATKTTVALNEAPKSVDPKVSMQLQDIKLSQADDGMIRGVAK